MIPAASGPRPPLPDGAAAAGTAIQRARAACEPPRFYDWPAFKADLASGLPLSQHFLAEVPTWEHRQDDTALD